jgi:hypothetical protein
MTMVREPLTPAATGQSSERTSHEVFRLLSEFESKHSILQYQSDGWCIWPVLRYAIATQLHRLSTGGSLPQVSLRDRLGMAVADLPKILSLPRSPILIKTVSTAYRNRTENGAVDVYFDDLYPHLQSAVTVAGVNSPAFRHAMANGPRPPHSTVSCIELAAALRSRQKPRPHELRTAGEISRAVLHDLGLPQYTPQRIARAVRWFHAQRGLYQKLLRRVGAKLVLAATPEEYGLFAAAKELGIPSIELQHGLFDRHHAAYVWPAVAADYGAHIPHSDYLMTYGQAFCEELQSAGCILNTPIPAGSPRIDILRAQRTANTDGPIRILLTTQGIDTTRLLHFLSQFLQLNTAMPDFRLSIKLHPGYETDKTPYLAAVRGDSRVSVLLGSEEPSTQKLLLQADLHVSISSTTHFEALAVGVPTAVLPFETHHYADMLTRSGDAEILRTPADLAAAAQHCRETKVPIAVSHKYFAPNAVQNICRHIDGLIGVGAGCSPK